jgi:hypothetical protein
LISVILLCAILLGVILLSVILLCAILLSVILPNVVAPFITYGHTSVLFFPMTTAAKPARNLENPKTLE